jgi:hypothetical protein
LVQACTPNAKDLVKIVMEKEKSLMKKTNAKLAMAKK